MTTLTIAMLAIVLGTGIAGGLMANGKLARGMYELGKSILNIAAEGTSEFPNNMVANHYLSQHAIAQRACCRLGLNVDWDARPFGIAAGILDDFDGRDCAGVVRKLRGQLGAEHTATLLNVSANKLQGFVKQVKCKELEPRLWDVRQGLLDCFDDIGSLLADLAITTRRNTDFDSVFLGGGPLQSTIDIIAHSFSHRCKVYGYRVETESRGELRILHFERVHDGIRSRLRAHHAKTTGSATERFLSLERYAQAAFALLVDDGRKYFPVAGYEIMLEAISDESHSHWTITFDGKDGASVYVPAGITRAQIEQSMLPKFAAAQACNQSVTTAFETSNYDSESIIHATCTSAGLDDDLAGAFARAPAQCGTNLLTSKYRDIYLEMCRDEEERPSFDIDLLVEKLEGWAKDNQRSRFVGVDIGGGGVKAVNVVYDPKAGAFQFDKRAPFSTLNMSELLGERDVIDLGDFASDLVKWLQREFFEGMEEVDALGVTFPCVLTPGGRLAGVARILRNFKGQITKIVDTDPSVLRDFDLADKLQQAWSEISRGEVPVDVTNDGTAWILGAVAEAFELLDTSETTEQVARDYRYYLAAFGAVCYSASQQEGIA